MCFCGRYDSHNAGKKLCKECDPIEMTKDWDTGNEAINVFLMNSIKTAENYDDPFPEYIPFDKLKILEKVGESCYGIVYHAKWYDGLRYIQSIQGGRCREKEIEVVVKEIKGDYNISYDILLKVIINNK